MIEDALVKAQELAVADQHDEAIDLLLALPAAAHSEPNYNLLVGLCYAALLNESTAFKHLVLELELHPANATARDTLKTMIMDYSLESSHDLERQRIFELNKQPGHLVDVGSCAGCFLLPFLDRGWHVTSVEPNDYGNRIQRAALGDESSRGKLELVDGAISADVGEIEFAQSNDYAGTYSTGDSEFKALLRGHFDEPESKLKRTITLASLLDNPPVDIVKIDVNGMECAALRGLLADAHFDKLPLCLMVETRCLVGGHARFAEVLGLLQQLGYVKMKIVYTWGRIVMRELPWLSPRELCFVDLSLTDGLIAPAALHLPVVNVLAIHQKSEKSEEVK